MPESAARTGPTARARALTELLTLVLSPCCVSHCLPCCAYPSLPRPGVMPSSPPLAAASSMSLPAAAPTTSVFSFSPVNMISAVKQRSAFAPVLRPPSSPPQACPRAHGEGLPDQPFEDSEKFHSPARGLQGLAYS